MHTKQYQVFYQLMNQAAWQHSVYNRSRNEVNAYIDNENTSGRPTKKRERLQVQCARYFGEFWATLRALHMIAENFGTIHKWTIHDEIMELENGADPIAHKHEAINRGVR